MSPEMSAIVSIIFLVLGAASVWTMMMRFGRQSTSRTLLIIHRVTGWLFALVFVAMTVVMAERVRWVS